MSSKSFKLIIIGDSGVGKTSLIKKYTKNKFSPSYLTTIGVEFESKEMIINGEKIQLQIWDTVRIFLSIFKYTLHFSKK